MKILESMVCAALCVGSAACGTQRGSSSLEVALDPPLATSASAVASAPALGCPAAEDIAIVTRLSTVDDRRADLVMIDRQLADRGRTEPPTNAALTRKLTIAEERELGPASSSPVWVMADGKLEACKLQPGPRLVVVTKDPWALLPLVVTTLQGECNVQKPRIGVQREAPPDRCEVHRQVAVARGLVDEPTAPAAIHEPFQERACTDPCELRRRVESFTSERGRRLDFSVATHVHTEPTNGPSGALTPEECSWRYDDFISTMAREPSGAVTELSTTGVDQILVEDGSIRGFVDEHVLAWDLYAWPEGGSPTQAKRVDMEWEHDEDNERISLSIDCGP